MAAPEPGQNSPATHWEECEFAFEIWGVMPESPANATHFAGNSRRSIVTASNLPALYLGDSEIAQHERLSAKKGGELQGQTSATF